MEKLKELRESEKKNPADLANLLGISIQAYYRYENGKNEPNISKLKTIADYFNVSLDYLVGRNYLNEVGYLNETERAVVDCLKKMTETNQMKLLIQAQGILIAQS